MPLSTFFFPKQHDIDLHGSLRIERFAREMSFRAPEFAGPSHRHMNHINRLNIQILRIDPKQLFDQFGGRVLILDNVKLGGLVETFELDAFPEAIRVLADDRR